MPWLVESFNQKYKTNPRDILTTLVPVVPQSEAIENQPDVADTSVDVGNDSPTRKEYRHSMDALLVEATTFGGDYSHNFSKVTQEPETTSGTIKEQLATVAATHENMWKQKEERNCREGR